MKRFWGPLWTFAGSRECGCIVLTVFIVKLDQHFDWWALLPVLAVAASLIWSSEAGTKAV